jgi:hypothetical protein
MPFDSESFEISDALATSQDVYEVQFPDWGVRTVPAAPTAINPNFQFPPPRITAIPASLAAIAIGPRSTVDRCWVSWDRQKLVAAIPGGAEFSGVVKESRLRPLSVGQPITFAQAGQNGILPSTDPVILFTPNPNNSPLAAMHQGFLYVFPKDSAPPYGGDEGQANANAVMTDPSTTTILPAKYADSAGVVWNFSDNNGGLELFMTPYLELLLYLRPPTLAPPTKRFPLLVDFTGQVTALGAFQPVAYIPIFGRKHVGIGLRNTTHVGDFRLGLLRGVRENTAPTTSPPFEVPAGTALAVPQNSTANFEFSNPCADYLIVYASVAAASNIQIVLAAYD